MNTLASIASSITSFVSSSKVIIIAVLVVFGLGAATGYYFTQKSYSAKIATLNAELDKYKTAAASDEAKTQEQKTITAALNYKASGAAVTETANTTSTITAELTNKTSASDADISVTSTPATVQLEYNGKTTTLTNTSSSSSSTTDGNKVVMSQQTTTKLDVTDIVNMQIANTILERDAEEARLKRQKKQNLFWGAVGGLAVGYIAHDVIK